MRKIFGLFIVFLFFTQVIIAQKREKIEKKWLAQDIEAVKFIPKILPLETQTKESLIKLFNYKGVEGQVEFGARFFGNGKAGGYTGLSVTVYTFKNALLSYEISTTTSKDSWQLIRSDIIEAWKQYAGIPFEEKEQGIFYKYTNDSVLQEYKNSISKEIGALKQVEVPAELKDEYEYLIAPFNEISVSNNGCGYGGTKPEGRKMIDLFISAGRVDLIENILKGYNHGGRIYAVIALLEMKKNGLKLTSEIEQTIEKVINLDIRTRSCSGCFSYTTTAKELLQQYKLL